MERATKRVKTEGTTWCTLREMLHHGVDYAAYQDKLHATRQVTYLSLKEQEQKTAEGIATVLDHLNTQPKAYTRNCRLIHLLNQLSKTTQYDVSIRFYWSMVFLAPYPFKVLPSCKICGAQDNMEDPDYPSRDWLPYSRLSRAYGIRRLCTRCAKEINLMTPVTSLSKSTIKAMSRVVCRGDLPVCDAYLVKPCLWDTITRVLQQQVAIGKCCPSVLEFAGWC